MRSFWRWWRKLPQNPIYQREKGNWGNPNPFYATIMRYSPFVVIAAIIFGFCAGTTNPALMGNEELLVAYCFLCIPSFLLSALTLFATFMAPALTAPTISLEQDAGTWEILRTTPIPTRNILAAKLFGGLSRLRIWPILFVLTMLQGAIAVVSFMLVGDTAVYWSVPVGIATALRPWLEIMLAAIAGLYYSSRLRSATIALVGAYSTIGALKLVNNNGIWLLIASLLDTSQTNRAVISLLAPTAVYGIVATGFAIGMVRQADRLEMGTA